MIRTKIKNAEYNNIRKQPIRLVLLLHNKQMQIPQPTPEGQTSSYLQTEFFFYMLTSYYALVSFSIRYNKIMKDPPQQNINRLPGQFLIQCLENQPQFVPGVKDTPIPASYVIKSKLCLLNSYLYLFMAAFSMVGTQDVFYACKHRKFGIIYLFGCAAWMMAAIVLRRQYMRKINQSLWTHRIFWIFSGTFAITKMFQDYLLPMNFALNIISISSNCVLAIYGIYRPEDNDTITLIDNQDIPGMFKLFFQYIELSSIVRKVLRIQQPSSSPALDNLDHEDIQQIDLNTLQKAFKVTTQSRRQEINLLNQLPRRNIFIDKKLQYIKNNNGTVKVCYFIFSQIGNQRFQASRTYKEFLKLQADLENVFNQKNFPKVTLPKIKKTQTSQMSNQCEVLEEWLVEVVKKPLLMIKPLLTFLNVNQQCSAAFLTYFDVSYRSFCSNTFMLAQLKKKQARTNRVSLVGYFDAEGESTAPSTTRIATLMKQKLEFIVQADEDVTDPKQFGFIFTCLREIKTKQKIRWKLLKYEQNILQVNNRIEEECKISIPFFYNMLAGLSKNHKSKAMAYRNYIQKLLSEEKYYCVSLFQFIRFDPVSIEVKTSGMDGGISKGQTEKAIARVSHYFQQYQDHTQNLVAVLRVDRLDSQSTTTTVQFKFQIRRKSFVLFRTSEQIIQLRKDLSQLYIGVCFVPVISYEDCNKYEAKQRTQKFLNALEGLPKITINESFAQFYYHTL